VDGLYEKILKDVPQAAYTVPDNMVALRINEEGHSDENGSLVEYFYQENSPSEQTTLAPNEKSRPSDIIKDQLL